MAKLSMRLISASIILTLGAMAASGAECGARADVIYVDDSATAGANTGQSWPDAFTDLQSALAIAQAGDEIRVAQGTYKPAPPGGDRTISFNLVSGTILQGGYAGFGASDPDANDPAKFETILSGDLNGDDGPAPFTNNADNAYHVVVLDAATARTEIRGITITAGNANDDDAPHRSGGGIKVSGGSDLLVDDCLLRRNRARAGSGIANIQSTITMERTRFVGNWCVPMDPTTGGGGLSTSGPATIDNCWFEDNRGGIGGGGGGIHNSSTYEMIVRRTTFYGNGAENTSASKGQAVYIDCRFQSNSAQWLGTTFGGRFINCVFANNGGSEGVGAAHQPLMVVNCLFVGNSGATVGAIVSSIDTVVLNCTIVGNRATSDMHAWNGGGVAFVQPSSPTLANCIIVDNETAIPLDTQEQQVMVQGMVNLVIDNSCIQGWTGSLGGVGNHGNDPRFIDADGPDDIYGTPDDDPRLRPNSPCIDSGDATLLPPDEFDLDDDGDVTEPLPIDLDGLPRVVGANLDMDAFEFQGIPCRADINGDASVGIDDLRAIINGWGSCVPGEECNADLNLDFTVSIDDLLAVISAWGPCG